MRARRPRDGQTFQLQQPLEVGENIRDELRR